MNPLKIGRSARKSLIFGVVVLGSCTVGAFIGGCRSHGEAGAPTIPNSASPAAAAFTVSPDHSMQTQGRLNNALTQLNTDAASARPELKKIETEAGVDQAQKAMARLGEANSDASNKRHEDAIKEYAAVAAMPDIDSATRVQALLNSAQLYQVENKLDRARDIYQGILTRNDIDLATKVQAKFSLAQLDLVQKKPDAARALFQAIIDTPDVDRGQKVQAHEQLAESLLQSNQPGQARAELSKILALSDVAQSQRIQAQQGIAQTYLLQKNSAAGLAEYAKLLKMDLPAAIRAQTYFQIAQVDIGRADPSGARVALGSLLAMTDVDDGLLVQGRLALAQSLIADKKFDDAKKACEAILADPAASDANKKSAQALEQRIARPAK